MKKLILALAVLVILIVSGCVSDPCNQKVKGTGLCEAYFEGYQYDSASGKCIKAGASGCSFESPFNSLEDCQLTCEK